MRSYKNFISRYHDKSLFSSLCLKSGKIFIFLKHPFQESALFFVLFDKLFKKVRIIKFRNKVSDSFFFFCFDHEKSCLFMIFKKLVKGFENFLKFRNFVVWGS